MPVTLKDIARKTNISYSAVSRILNNNIHYKYAKDTVNRVKNMAEEMGYYPDYLASSLRTGKRNIIGVALGNTLARSYDPFSDRVNKGIGEIAEQKEYYTLQFPLAGEKMAERLANASRSKMMDGLIFMVYSRQQEEFINETVPILKEVKMPFVALTKTPGKLEFHQVGCDYYQAGELATQHMVDQGYKNIMLVHLEGFYRNEHKQAYCDVMDRAGLKKGIVTMGKLVQSAPEAVAAAEKVIARAVETDAYVVYSDICGYGFLEALKQRGVSVPDQAGVIGCGDLLKDNIILTPLSSVDLKTEERGREAANVLFDEIDNGPGKEYKRVTLEPELIVRGSSSRLIDS